VWSLSGQSQGSPGLVRANEALTLVKVSEGLTLVRGNEELTWSEVGGAGATTAAQEHGCRVAAHPPRPTATTKEPKIACCPGTPRHLHVPVPQEGGERGEGGGEGERGRKRGGCKLACNIAL